MQNQVAVVTGSAQGIGAAVTRILAEKGVIVAAIDNNAAKLHKTVDALQRAGYRVAAFPLDITDSKAVASAIKQIEQQLGPIQYLVNVAGILRMGEITALQENDWMATFAVNVHGVFYLSQAVSKRMVERNSGAIVTVGSNAAKIPRVSMAAYAASKAAVVMFTKCLGLELAKHHIRCNVVSPGSTDTDMQRILWTSPGDAAKVIAGSPDTFKTGIPLQKIATVSEIAAAVLFLLSEQASHITMQDLCVDGGAILGV